MELKDIIKGCRKNDRKAQEELYRRYKDVLFVLCLKYCSNEAEAEDNLHNAFITIFTNIHTLRDTAAFEGWIKRITINKAISSFKKSISLSPIKEDFAEDTTIYNNDLETISANQIMAMVQQLPRQYRLVFSLYELDGYTHNEIAEMLSITESTSKSNLHRAKAILKEKVRLANDQYINVSNGNGK